MTVDAERYDRALDVAVAEARRWLDSIPIRPVPPRTDADGLRPAFGASVPAGPQDPAAVVAALAAAVEPGLMSIGSGRFFGWVMGGTLPAALAADWLVSAWDQNAVLRTATPGVAAAEETAAAWLLELLGLPTGAAVGFVTGATMSNFTCLAAARQRVLAAAGWDLAHDGLFGAPRVRVLVGEQRHDSVDVALRYLGLGAPVVVPADEQGRIEIDALADILADGPRDVPTIVCLQAGNLHSGAFDDFARAVEVAHGYDAWVHVDGAFGLWAAASPTHRRLVAGYQDADSWATDAHKTLNVPYDCGVAIVADQAAVRTAMGLTADYLPADDTGNPFERVPELSRRARGVPVLAALASLGRSGVADLVDRLVDAAGRIAAALADTPGVEVLNDVAYTQVCFALVDDRSTLAAIDALRRDGTTWMSGSRWRGRQVIRISVSNWTIDDADITASVDAVRRSVRTD